MTRQQLDAEPSPPRPERRDNEAAGAEDSVDEVRSPREPLGRHLLGTLAGPAGGITTTRRLRRNDLVYHRGDPANELYVVESGRIAIANRAPDGRECLVALIGCGELFGLCSLFDGNHRSTQARALELSTVVAVPYEPVRRVLEQRPALLWGLVRVLAARLRQTDQALADTAFLDVTGRTAKRILQMAGGAEEFQLPVTQEELAALVGASRERVNKSISTFVRLGWLAQHDRRYHILDRCQLQNRAGLGAAETA